MENLSIKQKIGQMLIIRINQLDDATIEFIKKYKIGGVILRKSNYSDYSDMLNLINKIREIDNIPMFITTDQEGGRVNRMPNDFLNIKDAYSIAKTENDNNVVESASLIGKTLKSSGFNVNYAPVLDIKRFEDNHAIGNRSYGKSKEDVARYGIEFMKELSNQGVLSVIKHFPGHGSTLQDSHFGFPYVKTKKEILETEDMYPFEEAIKNGAEAVMLGHIVINDIDKKYPASMSKIIINSYLREKFKFNGLIITDDLKMMAIKLRYSPAKSLMLAINAGNNMVMMGLPIKTVEKAIKKVAKKVKSKKVDVEHIDKSIDLILKLKEKYEIKDAIEKIDIEKINSEIEKLNSKIK